MPDEALAFLNGLAGLAALVNSLIMWPQVRSLKSLGPRVERLERHVIDKPRRGTKAKRKRSHL